MSHCISAGQRYVGLLLLTVSLVAETACISPAVGQAVGGLSLRDVLGGIAARQQELSACHVKFHYSNFFVGHESQPDILRDFDVVWYKGKFIITRSTFKDPTDPKAGYITIEHIGWDGHKRTGYQVLETSNPARRYSATIAPQPGEETWVGYWATAILDLAPEGDLPISDLTQMGTWKLIGTKRIGEYEAWGIGNIGTTIKLFPYSHSKYEIWVVPDHDFAIVEMSDTTRLPGVKPMGNELKDVTLKRWGKMWVMSKGEVTASNPNVDPRTDVNSFEVNSFSSAAPARAGFTIKIPVGTGVFDEITQTSFIAGKLVFSRQPDGSFQVIPIAKFPEYASMTDYTKGMTAAEWNKSPWAARLKQAIASMSSAGAAKAQEHGK